MALSGRACPLAIEAHRALRGVIILDDVASQALPPVKQRTLADICREKFLTPSRIS